MSSSGITTVRSEWNSQKSGVRSRVDFVVILYLEVISMIAT